MMVDDGVVSRDVEMAAISCVFLVECVTCPSPLNRGMTFSLKCPGTSKRCQEEELRYALLLLPHFFHEEETHDVSPYVSMFTDH